MATCIHFIHLPTWWCHQMETFPPLLALYAGIHQSPMISPHKGQWRGALMFSLICTWANGRANNQNTSDLRRHCTHHDATVMKIVQIVRGYHVDFVSEKFTITFVEGCTSPFMYNETYIKRPPNCVVLKASGLSRQRYKGIAVSAKLQILCVLSTLSHVSLTGVTILYYYYMYVYVYIYIYICVYMFIYNSVETHGCSFGRFNENPFEYFCKL